jgi:hypothetical protein
MPSVENLEYVFHSILAGHLATFNPDVLKAAPKIVKATVDLQKVLSRLFVSLCVPIVLSWEVKATHD